MVNNIYRIKTAKLTNFRCYEEMLQPINFGKECTVIIGYNGAGKTALLIGIKKAISFILTRDRRSTINFIGDGKDVRESLLKNHDVRYNYRTGLLDDDYHFPCQVDMSAKILGTDIDWRYIKPDKRTPLDKMAFRQQLDEVLTIYNNNAQGTILPLLAFFSDCYPHVRATLTKYEKDVLVDKSNNIERRAGYYHWDASSTDFYFWRDLYCLALRKINHPTSGLKAIRDRLSTEHLEERTIENLRKHEETLLLAQKQVDYIKRILIQFSRTYPTQDNRDFAIDDISEGSYLEDGKEVFTLMFHFKDGHDQLFDMLPEGHKRMIAIAFEMAYRFFILNKQLIYKDEYIKPQGIAIIDELELHLHPTLAQEALFRLRDTFPEVQFIVSTHSPAVISNIKVDGDVCKVLKLAGDHNFSEMDDSFGLSYSDTLMLKMGSYGRMHMLSLLEEMYSEYKEENDTAGMNEVRDELQKFFGDVPLRNQWVDELIAQWDA